MSERILGKLVKGDCAFLRIGDKPSVVEVDKKDETGNVSVILLNDEKNEPMQLPQDLEVIGVIPRKSKNVVYLNHEKANTNPA